jgi:hypothetical protein
LSSGARFLRHVSKPPLLQDGLDTQQTLLDHREAP